MGHLEALVFPANKEGNPSPMIEIMGGRGYTADEILCSFGSMMMEAGYDTI
jgi:hypothetical protein